jgi:hypothetical protein
MVTHYADNSKIPLNQKTLAKWELEKSDYVHGQVKENIDETEGTGNTDPTAAFMKGQKMLHHMGELSSRTRQLRHMTDHLPV